MRNFLISLASFVGLSLIGIAIIAIYLIATHFFPGVINELIILISYIILLTIAWHNYEDFIYDIWDKFDSEFIVGKVICVAVYVSLLIFIYRHGAAHTIPAFLWIITGTGLILMDNTITDGRHLWHERLFLLLTAIFLLSMYSNYDSQYIWLLAVPYVLFLVIWSEDVKIFTKDGLWKIIISSTVALACLTLTIIQYWTPIMSGLNFLLGLKVNGITIWIGIVEMVGMLLIGVVAHRLVKNKNRRTLLELQKTKKEKEEKEKKQAAEVERLENERIKNERLASALSELESGKVSWELLNEIFSIREKSITQEEKYWDKVLSLSLKSLVHISDTKQKLIWNDNQLVGALQIIDSIADRCFDDETLMILYEQLQKFEDYINYVQSYEGYNILKRRIETNCVTLNKLNYPRQ